MTDKKSNDSRRKLLKSIAAGGGAVIAGKSLPEPWSKPVINSVVLPAHATTSSIYDCQIDITVPFSATKSGEGKEGDYSGTQEAAGPFFGDCKTGFEFADIGVTITLSDVVTLTSSAPLSFSLISEAVAGGSDFRVNLRYKVDGEEPVDYQDVLFETLGSSMYRFRTSTMTIPFTLNDGSNAVRLEYLGGYFRFREQPLGHDFYDSHVDVQIKIQYKF